AGGDDQRCRPHRRHVQSIDAAADDPYAARGVRGHRTGRRRHPRRHPASESRQRVSPRRIRDRVERRRAGGDPAAGLRRLERAQCRRMAADQARCARGAVRHRAWGAPSPRGVAERTRRQDIVRIRDPARTFAARLSRSVRRGERAEFLPARTVAAGRARASRIPGDGRPRYGDGVGQRLRAVLLGAAEVDRRSIVAATAARDRGAVRFHRHRSRGDGHRSGTTAMGRARRDPHRGRRYPNAWSRRPDGDLRAPLSRPRRDRRHAHPLARARDDMTLLSTIGLPEIIAGIMVAALNAYVLTGGADFGGGVWDLLASGPSRDGQRSLIERSIAPIWEANHVWLIVVVVLLFSAFPAAFGTLGIVLHIPLSLMLVG